MTQSLVTNAQAHYGTAAVRAAMTTTGLRLGSTFQESDTRITYKWDLSAWAIVSFSGAPENVLTVSPSGAQYTTIQAALTAGGANTLVLVYPGTYTNDTLTFTGNNQTVKGMGETDDQHVTTANAVILNSAAYTDCIVQNIKMTATAVTTAKNITTGTATLTLIDCHIGVTCATDIVGAAQPSCIYTTGTVVLTRGSLDYNHTGETVAGIKAPIVLGTGAVVNADQTTIDIDTQGDALASAPAYGTGTGVFNPSRCSITVTNIAEVASGLEDTYTIGHAYVTGSGTHTVFNNEIHIENNASTGVGIYAAGTVTIRSMFNHIHVFSSTGTETSFFLAAAGVTIDSQMDDIQALNGENNSAGGTYGFAHSPSDGALAADAGIIAGVALNGINLDPSAGVGVAYTGTAQPTRNITLDFAPAEWADGADNNVAVTPEHDNTNHRNFWRCTSGAPNQDIDLVWSFKLPVNFGSWTSSAAFYIDVRSDSYAGHTMTASLYDGSGSVDAGISGANIKPDADNTWQSKSDLPTSSYSANSWIHLHVHCDMDGGGDTLDVARVYFTYKAIN